ncbi:MAG: 2-C-methyl-D-erythritol 2,4-cyclodiphosphate synthase [Elusimicrobiota bacterium]
MRVGLGFDIHKFGVERKLVLGGVVIPGHAGLVGHSDADVISHSVADALLGALGEGDIGQHFPNTDPQYKDISSLILLDKVAKILKDKNYEVNNLDVMVAAQEPKLSPYYQEMKENLVRALDLDLGEINIKATTTEGLGIIGQGEGIACWSIVSIIRRQL